MLVTCSIGCTSHQSLILYMVAINIYNRTRSNRGTGDPLHNHNLATMIIDQEEYAKKIVKRFGMENAKSVRTPLPTGYSPDLNSGNCTSQQRTYYQSIIGSLLYLALGTRPDICYAVILMSQFSV